VNTGTRVADDPCPRPLAELPRSCGLGPLTPGQAGQAAPGPSYADDPAAGPVTAAYNPDDPADKISYEHGTDGHVNATDCPDSTSVTAR